MNGSQMAYFGGRVICTTAQPTYRGPNALPFDASGRICVGPAVVPRAFVAGIPYGAGGRISVDITGAAIVGYVAGLPVGPLGRILCTTTGAIARYIRGIPVAEDGRVCLETPVAGSFGLDDLDGDELPDTTLLDLPGGPDVTEDEDSFNIDINGDGTVDIVVPKP